MWKYILVLSVIIILFSTLMNYHSENPVIISLKRKVFDIEEKFHENSFLTIEWEENNEFNLYIDETYFLHSLERHKTTESYILYPLTYSEKARNPEKILNIAVIGPATGFMVNKLQDISSVFSSVDVYTTDSGITEFFRSDRYFSKINERALLKSNVKIIRTDDLMKIPFDGKKYDLMYLNFLDPYNPQIAKYYTRDYFKVIEKSLKDGGMIVVNGTSPFFTKRSAETIYSNLKGVYRWVRPYYINLNAQGEWAYFIASQKSHEKAPAFVLQRAEPRYLNEAICDTLEVFPSDTRLRPFRHAGGIDQQFISGWKSYVNSRAIQMKL